MYELIELIKINKLGGLIHPNLFLDGLKRDRLREVGGFQMATWSTNITSWDRPDPF